MQPKTKATQSTFYKKALIHLEQQNEITKITIPDRMELHLDKLRKKCERKNGMILKIDSVSINFYLRVFGV